MKVNITKRLKQIYKANSCTDLSDCERAINSTLELINDLEKENRRSDKAFHRLSSLVRRKERFV